VPCTAEVILACQSLRTAGYRLALAGLIGKAEQRPLAMLAGAISLLGEREFRRWAAIVALVMIGADKPAELIRTALAHAYFCEELARPLGLTKNSSELFLMACCPPRMHCWTAL
jgi:hypothetical protein